MLLPYLFMFVWMTSSLHVQTSLSRTVTFMLGAFFPPQSFPPPVSQWSGRRKRTTKVRMDEYSFRGPHWSGCRVVTGD